MRVTRKFTVVAIATIALAGVTPLLTACNPQALVQNAVENAVEDATGVDVNMNADGTASQTLPDGWPSSIPVVSGTILYSGSLGSGDATTWTVSIQISDAKAAYDDAKGKLEGAGFTATLDSQSDGVYAGVFDNGEYGVTITSDGSSDPKELNYVVSTTTSVTG